MPSIRKHHPSLDTAITMPASDGPIRRATLTIEELMAMALERSLRSGLGPPGEPVRWGVTICTMNDWRPGMSKALMRPWKQLRIRISVMLMRCESVSHASSSDWTMARVWVQMRTWRRSERSTITPASGASRNVGIWPAKLTVPSSSADFVNR